MMESHMRLAWIGTVLTAVCLATGVLPAQEPPVDGQTWPQWRGPLATGEAPDADPPVEWSETRNIRWKVPIPGGGSATPLVWGDRVFVTTAIPTGEGGNRPGFFTRLTQRFTGTVGATETQRFVVMALNRANGGSSGSGSCGKSCRTRASTKPVRGHRRRP